MRRVGVTSGQRPAAADAAITRDGLEGHQPTLQLTSNFSFTRWISLTQAATESRPA
jgi:hypothetical protein